MFIICLAILQEKHPDPPRTSLQRSRLIVLLSLGDLQLVSLRGNNGDVR